MTKSYQKLLKKRDLILQNHLFDRVLKKQKRKVYHNYMIKSIYNPRERNASMQINFEWNSFFDYAKDKNGDIFDFVMITENLNFRDAVDYLYKLLDERQNEYRVSRKKMVGKVLQLKPFEFDIISRIFYRNIDGGMNKLEAMKCALIEKNIFKNDCFQRVSSFMFFEDLMTNDDPHMLDYLQKDRKLTRDTIAQFTFWYIANPNYTSNILKENFSPLVLKASGYFNNDLNFVFWKNNLLIGFEFNKHINYISGKDIRYYPANFKNSKYIGLYGYTRNQIFNYNVLSKLKRNDELYIMEGELDTVLATQAGLNAIGFPSVNAIPYKQLKNLN